MDTNHTIHHFDMGDLDSIREQGTFIRRMEIEHWKNILHKLALVNPGYSSFTHKLPVGVNQVEHFGQSF